LLPPELLEGEGAAMTGQEKDMILLLVGLALGLSAIYVPLWLIFRKSPKVTIWKGLVILAVMALIWISFPIFWALLWTVFLFISWYRDYRKFSKPRSLDKDLGKDMG
jgi:hypothetical protein